MNIIIAVLLRPHFPSIIRGSLMYKKFPYQSLWGFKKDAFSGYSNRLAYLKWHFLVLGWGAQIKIDKT